MNPLIMKLVTQLATKENAFMLFKAGQLVDWRHLGFSTTEYLADRIAFHIVKYETKQRKINVI